MLNLCITLQLLVLCLKLLDLFLVDALALVLTVSLAEHLDLKCLLVGILSHHSPQLKGVAI